MKALCIIFVLIALSKAVPVEQSSREVSSQSNLTLSSQEEAALNSISNGANSFAMELYSLLAKNEGNLVFSPLSLQIVIALAFSGAKGGTASELAKLISVSDTVDETTLLGYSSLIRIVQDPSLSLANRMFVELSYPIKNDFQKVAEEYFYSPAESLDFLTAPVKSCEYINSWVEKQTNGKITDLLSSDAITAETKVVLINAIYYKANWKTTFNDRETKEAPFYVSNTKSVQVQMMNTKSDFFFYHDYELGVKFLRLDYEGDDFQMVLILPDDVEGLSDVESKLKTIDLFEKVKSMQSTTVDVYLPKFKLEKLMELKNVLSSMGAPTMFSDAAEFGSISVEPLKVSSVVQKAFVEINEEGTEAAAATAMVMYNRVSIGDDDGPQEEAFVADHPFVFSIVMKNYPVHLFVGRFSAPE